MALEAHGVYADVDLADLTYPFDGWVHLSPEPFAAPSRQFPTEKELEKVLARYHRQLLARIPELAGATSVRSQAVVPAHSKKYRVDLMFRAADDTRVIIELKRGEPHGDAAFGLSKYAKALQANGKTVRAVLITARPTDPVIEETVREQLTQVPCPVSWYWYDLDVKFEKLV